MKRYLHDWNTPIKVVVFGVTEDRYYSPHYNPRLLPVPETTNALAASYERCTPFIKQLVLAKVQS